MQLKHPPQLTHNASFSIAEKLKRLKVALPSRLWSQMLNRKTELCLANRKVLSPLFKAPKIKKVGLKIKSALQLDRKSLVNQHPEAKFCHMELLRDLKKGNHEFISQSDWDQPQAAAYPRYWHQIAGLSIISMVKCILIEKYKYSLNWWSKRTNQRVGFQAGFFRENPRGSIQTSIQWLIKI